MSKGERKHLRYMLDTNICIYAMKKKPEVVREMLQHKSREMCISSITYAELMHGVAKSQYQEKTRAKTLEFLEGIEILEFDGVAAEAYGKIKTDLYEAGLPITPNDMLIAAHANSLDLTLVTHNVREFARVEGLEVADWT